MYIDKYREIITSSVHNIPQRLKRIDKGYFLVRNHKTGQFEVHHREQIGSTLAVSIPYDELDERTIQRVRETRVEYIDKIVAEMDKKNEKIETEQNRKRHEVTETVTKDIYRYLKKHESKEVIDNDSRYLKGVG